MSKRHLILLIALSLFAAVPAFAADAPVEAETPEACIADDADSLQWTSDVDAFPSEPFPVEPIPACGCKCPSMGCSASYPHVVVIANGCDVDSSGTCDGRCACACQNSVGAQESGSRKAGKCQ